MERVNFLICDLDGTLLGDKTALDEFAAWYGRAKARFRLAYSSGRLIDSIFESLDEFNLPGPDAVIGGVGTEIYDLSTARRIQTWPPVSYSWNPDAIRDIGKSHRELTPQPEHFCSLHKVSFYGRDLDALFLMRLVRQLAVARQEVSVIYSSNRDLDVVPRNVNKGAAAAFLATYFCVDFKSVIVAGDSGNDAAMFDRKFRSIIVGNAQEELRSLKAPHIYQATNEYAAGVLEGLEHWLRLMPANSRVGRSSADRDAGRGRRG